MDFIEAQEFFKNQYAGKNVIYEFDDSCHRFNELVFTNGSPNMMHHIECRKVKVMPDGVDPFYVSIAPHRMTVTWVDMKKIIEAQISKTDVHINEDILKELSTLAEENLEVAMKKIIDVCGISKVKLKNKIASVKR